MRRLPWQQGRSPRTSPHTRAQGGRCAADSGTAGPATGQHRPVALTGDASAEAWAPAQRPLSPPSCPRRSSRSLGHRPLTPVADFRRDCPAGPVVGPARRGLSSWGKSEAAGSPHSSAWRAWGAGCAGATSDGPGRWGSRDRGRRGRGWQHLGWHTWGTRPGWGQAPSGFRATRRPPGATEHAASLSAEPCPSLSPEQGRLPTGEPSQSANEQVDVLGLAGDGPKHTHTRVLTHTRLLMPAAVPNGLAFSLDSQALLRSPHSQLPRGVRPSIRPPTRVTAGHAP